MNAVVFEEVCQRFDVGQVVDGNHLECRTADQLTEGQTADAAKSVDSNALHVCTVELFRKDRLDGQNPCDAHFVLVDFAFGADGDFEGRQLDFVVDDPSHHIVVTLAKGLDGGHAQA